MIKHNYDETKKPVVRSKPMFQRRINVVSMLWINTEITLIRRWKWNKIQGRIFNVAQRWYNVSVPRWNNVETKLIQFCLNFVPTCTVGTPPLFLSAGRD